MTIDTYKIEKELNEPRTIKKALELHGANGKFLNDARSFEDPIIRKIMEYLNPEINNKIGVAITLFNTIASAGYAAGYEKGHKEGYNEGYDSCMVEDRIEQSRYNHYNDWEAMGR